MVDQQVQHTALELVRRKVLEPLLDKVAVLELEPAVQYELELDEE